MQFAAKTGFETAVIALGREKASPARELGARRYVDSTLHDVVAELLVVGIDAAP